MAAATAPTLNSQRSIALVGMSGAGKTAVARELASQLGLRLVSVDKVLAAETELTIPELFSHCGEAEFRRLETEALVRILAEAPSIIDTGGGLPATVGNRVHLRQAGCHCVYLSAGPEVLIGRIGSGAGRPMLTGDNPALRLRELLAVREPAYRALADLTILVDDQATPAELATRIVSWLTIGAPSAIVSDADCRILIGSGLLGEAASYDPVAGRRTILVCDAKVAGPLALTVQGVVSSVAELLVMVVVPAGETCKNWALAGDLCTRFAASGLDRDSVVMALGGGSIGDLVGFAAAVYMRGVDCLQLPTTLLAMVDASVGGKTAVNLAGSKNLVGVFNRPLGVIADLRTLASLPEREYRAGLAEIVKHALLDRRVLELLETADAPVSWPADPERLIELIRRSVRCKAEIVARDERERSGVRATLNLGHSFAHALEAILGWGAILHGEAVAIGLLSAARLAERIGLAELGLAAQVEALLVRCGLPSRWPAHDRTQLHAAMLLDKKNRAGKSRLILPVAVGNVRFVEDVERAAIDAVIDELSA